ncbi:hypothetical protein GCM10010277_85290 [Streptomyces longisporoflavus]|nr:hypothetical protein GCM10010277_85290 [Streptomyces longisporoflavus]
MRAERWIRPGLKTPAGSTARADTAPVAAAAGRWDQSRRGTGHRAGKADLAARPQRMEVTRFSFIAAQLEP